MAELEDYALAARPYRSFDDKAPIQNLSRLKAQTIIPMPPRMTHVLFTGGSRGVGISPVDTTSAGAGRDRDATVGATGLEMNAAPTQERDAAVATRCDLGITTKMRLTPNIDFSRPSD